MSSHEHPFTAVKHWFNELVELEPAARQQKLQELKQQQVLDKAQLQLLKDMLHADDDPNFTLPRPDLDTNDQMTAELSGQVGPYRLVRMLDRGGMGQVYLAERNDGHFKQTVALKLPHLHLTEKNQARFETERQILAQLNHEHIARLLDGGQSDQGQPYLAMEYIEGQTIDAYCVERLPSLSERIELVIQICQAIGYAHQNLVLHRDIKPSNILVTPEGQVKLLDFGIAQLQDLDSEDQAKQTETQIMTRHYASPEQIQGLPISTHSDVFSIAVIAFELFTGHHPYRSITPMQREQHLISGKIQKVSGLSETSEAMYPELAGLHEGKIVGDLENIMYKALSIDPQRRYASAQALADDLRLFLSHRPVSARKPSAWYVFKKWVQRNQLVSALSGITVAALVFTSVYATGQARYALQQQKLMQIEQAKAAEVADFLKDLFKQAKPMSDKNQLTAQDLLLAGFERIESEKFANPAVTFELLDVIHDSLLALGLVEESKQRVQAHLDNCQALLSSSHKMCVQLMFDQSRILHFEGQSADSLQWLEKARSLAEDRQPQDPQELANIYAEMNADLLNLNRKDEAKTYMLKLVAMEQQSSKPNLARLFEATHELATIEIFQQNFAQAWHHIEQNQSNILKFPADQQDAWRTHLYGLQSLYYTVRNQAMSAYEFRKKRAELEAEYVVKPRGHGRTLYILGDLAIRAGLFEAAEQHLNDSLSFYQSQVSNSQFQQHQVIGKQAYLFALLNRQDEAQATFEKLLEAQQSDPDLNGYSQTSYYMKSKMLVESFQQTASQMQASYDAVEADFLAANSHMYHHDLFLDVMTIKIKLKEQDTKGAQIGITQLQKKLDDMPEDYQAIRFMLQVLTDQWRQLAEAE